MAVGGGTSYDTPDEFFDARNAACRAARLAAAAAMLAALLVDDDADIDVFDAVVRCVISSLSVRSRR